MRTNTLFQVKKVIRLVFVSSLLNTEFRWRTTKAENNPFVGTFNMFGSRKLRNSNLESSIITFEISSPKTPFKIGLHARWNKFYERYKIYSKSSSACDQKRKDQRVCKLRHILHSMKFAYVASR
jgi:hypothetical protein